MATYREYRFGNSFVIVTDNAEIVPEVTLNNSEDPIAVILARPPRKGEKPTTRYYDEDKQEGLDVVVTGFRLSLNVADALLKSLSDVLMGAGNTQSFYKDLE